jgi:hypothetical protein
MSLKKKDFDSFQFKIGTYLELKVRCGGNVETYRGHLETVYDGRVFLNATREKDFKYRDTRGPQYQGTGHSYRSIKCITVLPP